MEEKRHNEDRAPKDQYGPALVFKEEHKERGELGKSPAIKKISKYITRLLKDEVGFPASSSSLDVLHPIYDHLVEDDDMFVHMQRASGWKPPAAPQYTTERAADSEETWAPLAPEQVIDSRYVVIVREQVPDSAEVLNESEIIKRLVENRVVKGTTELSDIAADETRTNLITRIKDTTSTGGRSPGEFDDTITETEQQAALDFQNFLQSYITVAKKHDLLSFDIERAQDILENLTFIGDKERQEALRGLALYWKSYLRENDDGQICLIPGAENQHTVKSGTYMLESVLGEFSEEELIEFEGRLVTNTKDLVANPDRTKIIMLDDWIISGTQMAETTSALLRSIPSRYEDCLEINLITSGAERIENGLTHWEHTIPIRSYFLSKKVNIDTNYTQHNAYETGAHSSVDYDFEYNYISTFMHQLKYLHQDIAEARSSIPSIMPGLTTIVRPYRNHPLTILGAFRARRNKAEITEFERIRV